MQLGLLNVKDTTMYLKTSSLIIPVQFVEGELNHPKVGGPGGSSCCSRKTNCID